MLHSIDTSNTAIASRYQEIPYDALPHPATHPARMASIATVVGHLAPRVESCRVLEVGCNDGANLIPMAVSLPKARFVGCDLSPRAIEEGRRTIDTLGLTNIVLLEADLAALAPEHGSFDFIVAHGVYSWVPPQVRDALFALAAKRLADHGILYVSFNVLPGCRVRQAVWDILHHHVDRIDDARARLDAARQLARLIAEGGSASLESDQPVRTELRAIAQRSDSELCHDDLAVPNEPVLFHSFAEHAGRHGLRYLADAELHTMDVTGVSSEAQAYLSTLDFLAREQYLDFVRLRRFRQSLLVRHDAPAEPGRARNDWAACTCRRRSSWRARLRRAGSTSSPVRQILPPVAEGRCTSCSTSSWPGTRRRCRSPPSTVASISGRCPGPSRMS